MCVERQNSRRRRTCSKQALQRPGVRELLEARWSAAISRLKALERDSAGATRDERIALAKALASSSRERRIRVEAACLIRGQVEEQQLSLDRRREEEETRREAEEVLRAQETERTDRGGSGSGGEGTRACRSCGDEGWPVARMARQGSGWICPACREAEEEE